MGSGVVPYRLGKSCCTNQETFRRTNIFDDRRERPDDVDVCGARMILGLRDVQDVRTRHLTAKRDIDLAHEPALRAHYLVILDDLEVREEALKRLENKRLVFAAYSHCASSKDIQSLI